MKARLSGIAFLFVIIAPAVLTYAWLQYQKYEVRHEIKERIIRGMDKNELVVLKFTKKEAERKLRWEHSREFEYNDQMYDVVETKTKGDSIFYHCWWDKKETKLNIQLAELVKQALHHNPQKQERQESLQNFLQSLYYSTGGGWSFTANYLEVTCTAHYSDRLINQNYPPPTPPPKLS